MYLICDYFHVAGEQHEGIVLIIGNSFSFRKVLLKVHEV